MINDYEAKTPITSEDFSSTDKPTNDDVISTLNGLIETCKDGQNGFQEAAEGVQRSDLKSLFYEFSQQRAQFAGELQSLVQTLGGDPTNSGSALAALHRGWINIKSVVTGKDEKAILNECERGEDSAKNNYKAAVESNLPANVRETVMNQFTSVKAGHDRIKALRDSYDTADGSSANTASTSY